MIKLIIVYILSREFLFHEIYQCKHDEISKKHPIKLKRTTAVEDEVIIDGKRLQESWRPIDILFDFSNIRGVDPQFKTFVQDTIFTQIKEILAKILLVQGPKKSRSYNQVCEDPSVTIPAEYTSKTFDHDLIVFVALINEDSSYLAYAQACALDNVTGRPHAGLMLINTKFLQIGRKEIQHFYHIFLHEMMHILVLNSNLYEHYLNQPAYRKEQIKTDSGTTNVFTLITPKVIQEAKNHFKCSSLTGLYLENQGAESSVGSHFETRTLGNEIMTAKKSGFSEFSRFSFALLEDSGWYKVDYSYADSFAYGADNGCEFINNHSCKQKFKEYCSSEGQTSCSSDYMSKTVCKQSEFADSCQIFIPVLELHCLNTYSFYETSLMEESGVESRCFDTIYQTQNHSGCYKSKCQDDKLKITVEGQQYECAQKGDVIKINENFEIICPNPQDFCTKFSQKCNNDCSANGFCSSGKLCQCDYFYKGSTCSEKQECHNNDATICSQLKEVSSTLSFNNHPYFKEDDDKYHKFEQGHIYSQANGHAKGDQGESNVYSSSKKSQAHSHGTDYSNARTKYHSFNNKKEYGFDNDHDWGYQSEFQKKAQQQTNNNSNAEAYGNANTSSTSQNDDTQSSAYGDDFSKSEADFNQKESSQNNIKQSQKGFYGNKGQNILTKQKNDTKSHSKGTSHGKGHSFSKGNKNGAEQHNKGEINTNSNAKYGHSHKIHHSNVLQKYHDGYWNDHDWNNKEDDCYWDKYY